MAELEDNSVNLVVMDPPYNIGKDHWDKVDNYVGWMGKVFTECERVLKDNGSLYFFHNDFLQIVDLQQWLNNHSGLIFKQLITWNKIKEDFKNIGFVQQRLSIDMQRNYYNGFTEYCLYYTFQDESGLKTLNNDKSLYLPLKKYVIESIGENKCDFIKCLSEYYSTVAISELRYKNFIGEQEYRMIPKKAFKYVSHFFNKNYEELRQEYEELRQEYEELRFSFNTANVKEDLRANSNMWLYPPAKNLGHITPKPVELIENIIEHSSNEGDLVLDPFLGSGTTLIACKILNRNFIGYEKELKYEAIIKKRISEHIPSLNNWA
jgi:site-specific DNA-methyltransferase (adenine-specific)